MLGLGWDLRFCISDKRLGDSMLLAPSPEPAWSTEVQTLHLYCAWPGLPEFLKGTGFSPWPLVLR